MFILILLDENLHISPKILLDSDDAPIDNTSAFLLRWSHDEHDGVWNRQRIYRFHKYRKSTGNR